MEGGYCCHGCFTCDEISATLLVTPWDSYPGSLTPGPALVLTMADGWSIPLGAKGLVQGHEGGNRASVES